MTSAEVIADSVSPRGDRVTTLEVTCHRFVLAEFNTHRAFSRNSASSRAIPLKKQIQMVVDKPAMPMSWPQEQPGMSGGVELTGSEHLVLWQEAAQNAINSAIKLGELGLHKSVTNRLLEPFMWHKIIVTSTEWVNFFEQRCSSMAQPEIRMAAYAMRDALDRSEPEPISLDDWHLPYINDEDYDSLNYPQLKQVSAARCARVSYLTHDGKRDVTLDLELYTKLVANLHWSPLEHVCRPITAVDALVGNLQGFRQLRHEESGF